MRVIINAIFVTYFNTIMVTTNTQQPANYYNYYYYYYGMNSYQSYIFIYLYILTNIDVFLLFFYMY